LDAPVSGFLVSEDVVEGLLARKLKASAAAAAGGAAVDVKPPKLAKALFFSCPSSPPIGFRRRAFLITRPLISASGACNPKTPLTIHQGHGQSHKKKKTKYRNGEVRFAGQFSVKNSIPYYNVTDPEAGPDPRTRTSA
jgi:hypothetical protein